ncbi:MAG: class I SAM-dependent methyltransferase [Gammaproteobacteria bacterium]|nr:class I SAM-dependent methyltransferase [Gammaproteobacteria bacterium]
MKDKVENSVCLGDDGVWKLSSSFDFDYSDGSASERYLRDTFLKVSDLSANSIELASYIKDWPSEYHLSRKRHQLLKDFDFSATANVLEVGCGCGAITRFLGERFSSVLAIEGSESRASLARLRTSSMANVDILCAPFQEVKFEEKFDIVFCIGVFEYANVFVDASNPHDAILNYFDDILTDNGVLVLAIENQFGLKYFCSSAEDHTGKMFDGIEGYPRFDKKAKTFGYHELEQKLSKHFAMVEPYFPYPDYKIPSAVISKDFFSVPGVADLLGSFSSRDYSAYRKPLFDESLALKEIEKNGQLHFFSNSFLFIAHKSSTPAPLCEQIGVMYNLSRCSKFDTRTTFKREGLSIRVSKNLLENTNIESDFLEFAAEEVDWVSGNTLQSLILKRSKQKGMSIEEVFEPCRVWIEFLTNESIIDTEGKRFLSGSRIDAIWQNTIVKDGGIEFIDQEWAFKSKISLNTLFIRGVYRFLQQLRQSHGTCHGLKVKSNRRLIRQVIVGHGINLTAKDFSDFVLLEASFQSSTRGLAIGNLKITIFIKLYLNNIAISMLGNLSGFYKFYSEKFRRHMASIVINRRR